MRTSVTKLSASVLVAAVLAGLACANVNAIAGRASDREVLLARLATESDPAPSFRTIRLRNRDALNAVAMCESSLRPDVEIIDTNGEWSRGILQFQDATWAWMSEESGVGGSPLDPVAAFRVADWAFSNGLAHHWSCARKLGYL